MTEYWKHQITIEIDETALGSVTDETLAFWWSAAQHNPADGFAASEPGELAMKVGWEIIRRWLAGAPVEMHHHQQSHYYWHELARHGNWSGPGRSFVPHAPAVDPEMLIDALKDAQDRAITTGRPERAAEYENARKALEQGAQASGPADPQNHAEAATAAGEGNHG